ncbi:O-antigen polymerase [Vibrio vulnificus]|uniref:O-antigen polymerase n=1 Tax=Vibrio vulnificus TaxID=672 RepID=UPI0018E1C049|nr:O-antigen polymerase [Vibrio vulnificus]
MRRIRLLDVCNPGAFFLIQFFFYFGIGVFLYFFDLIPFDVASYTIKLIFLYLMVFILSAYVISDRLIGRNAPRLQTVTVYNIKINHAFYICMVVAMFSILMLIGVHISNGFVPALGGDNINSLRVQAMVGKGRFVIPAFSLLYIANSILFSIYSLLDSKIRKILAFIILICSFFAILSFGFRSPSFYLLITVGVLNISLTSSYQEKVGLNRKLVVFFSMLVIFLVIAGLFRDGVSVSTASLNGLFYAFSVNLFNLNQIVINYPSVNNYLYGFSFINDLSAVIPGLDGEFLGNYLKEQLKLDFDGSSISATAIGEGYVNLGLIGVILHAIFTGTFSGLMYSIFARRNTIWSRLFLVIFALSFGRIVTGGVSAILFFSILPNMLLLVFFFLILKSRCKYGKVVG